MVGQRTFKIAMINSSSWDSTSKLPISAASNDPEAVPPAATASVYPAAPLCAWISSSESLATFSAMVCPRVTSSFLPLGVTLPSLMVISIVMVLVLVALGVGLTGLVTVALAVFELGSTVLGSTVLGAAALGAAEPGGDKLGAVALGGALTTGAVSGLVHPDIIKATLSTAAALMSILEPRTVSRSSFTC